MNTDARFKNVVLSHLRTFLDPYGDRFIPILQSKTLLRYFSDITFSSNLHTNDGEVFFFRTKLRWRARTLLISRYHNNETSSLYPRGDYFIATGSPNWNSHDIEPTFKLSVGSDIPTLWYVQIKRNFLSSVVNKIKIGTHAQNFYTRY